MKNISVIGAGTMGNGIAHVFAQNNFNVTLMDISEVALQKAISTITKIGRKKRIPNPAERYTSVGL